MIVSDGRTVQLQASQGVAPRWGKLKDPRALVNRSSRFLDTESVFPSSKVEHQAKKCNNNYTSGMWNNAYSREKNPFHDTMAKLCFE